MEMGSYILPSIIQTETNLAHLPTFSSYVSENLLMEMVYVSWLYQ